LDFFDKFSKYAQVLNFLKIVEVEAEPCGRTKRREEAIFESGLRMTCFKTLQLRAGYCRGMGKWATGYTAAVN